MSKIKMSFSLILAIFLVGILSTAAFAKSAYTWSVTPDSVTKTFAISVTPITGDTGFVVKTYTKDSSTGTVTATGKSYTLTLDSTSGKYTGTIPASDVTVGQLYQVSLFNATGTNELQNKLAVISDSSNAQMAHGSSALLDQNGSGLSNVNHTGADVKRKSGQGVHGFYQNNTNSCASCHQTHTSDDGSNMLLMKNGSYSTCSSCHDGTTGAYNSFSPVSTTAPDSITGTFNVSYDAAHNGSIHEADGSLKVSAAPGGNHSPAAKTPFASSFDCTSCHNPHGGGSAEENNLSEDPLGWGTVAYTTSTQDGQYGKLYKNPTIYTPGTIPTTKGAPYIFVLNTAGLDATAISNNYFYNRQHVTANTPILQTYRWQKGGYAPDYSLWLQEKGYPFKADTVLYNGTKDITRDSDVTVVWKDGFAYGAGVASVVSTGSQFSLGIDVETTPFIQTLYQEDFTKTVTNKDGSTSSYSYVPDSGVEMSKYCASCHTDYLSVTRNDNTGVYSTAHRHMTLADETNCVRCHFAHGSDAGIMKDSNDQTVNTAGGAHQGNLDYYTDVNPSSALKRYTGMSVCYACHGQGEQFLSNPNNVERPLFGQPGATRSTDPNAVAE
jgi:predicted CXXCH cytochrome family protein